MSKAKSERLMNLFILLLNARNYVTRDHIRATIEGYRGQSDEAFSRMFERDKDELRAAGIPIETGSNDPDSDEQDGYRVLRSDFELPPVEFTPSELAVLGVANSVWQESVAAQQTTEALATLRAAGIEADPLGIETLRPSIGAEPGLDELLTAIHDRRLVTFDYRGEPRRVHPWRLLQRKGRWFLLGFDLDREAPRHFKLSRFTSRVSTRGRFDAYAIPDAETLSAAMEFNAADEIATGLVAVRRGMGHDLTRDAEEAEWDGDLPEGFQVFRISRPFAENLAGEVCALGPDAIMLAPARLRTAVVEQLQTIVGQRPR